MAAVTSQQATSLGPIIQAYGRSTKTEDQRKIDIGEEEIFRNYDGIENGEPDECVFLTQEEIDIHIKVNGRYAEKCFLWVIDSVSIKIIREKNAKYNAYT